MKNSDLAFEIARRVHKGQTDKGGNDYFFCHVLCVANYAENEDELTVALLHDTIEDSCVTIMEINTLFGENIGQAVHAMTHQYGESYMDYIRRVKKNDLAKKVKMYDLRNNMDLRRLNHIGFQDIMRWCKYKRAEMFLKAK